MKHSKLLMMFACASILWMSHASAFGFSETLASWDLAGNSATAQEVDVLNTASGVSASTITAHGVNILQYNYSVYEGVFVANHWSTNEYRDVSKYYEWSVVDSVGYALEALTLSLSRGKYERDYDPNEPFGASKWSLYVNDQFAGMLDLDNYDGQGSFAEPDEPIVWTANLADIIQSPQYTFRLYGYSDEGGSDYAGLNESWYDHQGTDVVLSGSSAQSMVPEPLTMFSVAIGLTTLGIYFKRRQTQPVQDF